MASKKSIEKYILTIDQGTTSTIVCLVDENGEIVFSENKYVPIQIKEDKVLQNPNDIYHSVVFLISLILQKNHIKANQIKAIGITNQRETSIIWDKTTGKEIAPAISWQSQHTLDICEDWINKGYEELVNEKTGLKINPYFSASKIISLLNDFKGAKSNLLFGTVDTYLLWKMTGEHKTDVTNASRTMLYNINDKKWDLELLELFNIPNEILPKVYANDHLFGYYTLFGHKIPIYSMIGDQQSSLVGHGCFNEGDIKNTYGTGCFALINTGESKIKSNHGLLTTIAYEIKDKTIYSLEGSVFMGGSVMTWGKEQLNLLSDVNESEELAYKSVDDTLYFVPSFMGLGTPYWDSNVRGSFLGIKRHSNKNDFIKASLNSIAYQVNDLITAMKKDSLLEITKISVDGGGSKNNYLLQFQSDISRVVIVKSDVAEKTALGAAYIAGVASGFFKSLETIPVINKKTTEYSPLMDLEKSNKLKNGWKKAIKAVQTFKVG